MKILSSSILTRLQISFLAFILLSIVGGILFFKVLNTIVAREAFKSKIDHMVAHFSEARKLEKDFLLYDRKNISFLEKGSCESLREHAEALREMKQLIKLIVESGELEESDPIKADLYTIKAAIEGYESTFAQLAASYKIRGFKDHGLEGTMREVIHELQKCESKEEQWYALMLRRHEKDFFIRQDKKYIETLHNRAGEFIAFVQASTLPHMSPAYKEATVASIAHYVDHFNRIAAIDSNIGLTKNEGLIGILTEQAERTKPLLVEVQQMIDKRNQELVENSFLILLISGMAMVACGIGFSLLLARKISGPIIQLSELVENASIGDQTTSRSLEAMERKDELGKLVKSFGNMFREINLKVQEISEKNIGLEEAAQKEKERNWFNKGGALFESIMAGEASNLAQLCDQFLLQLVKYTNSSQAALFLKEQHSEGEAVMQLKSCYALDKKRYVNREIELGEGLVGAVWQEKEAYYINDIPESYSKIRSGLGQAKPTAIFIVPAVLEGEVEAIVEIGSFKEFTENEKVLIVQVCKGLANAVSRVRMQEQTKHLLSQSHALTNELQQSEEEMKQQLEEMQATREELEKNNTYMQNKVKTLESALQDLREFVCVAYPDGVNIEEHLKLSAQNELN